MGYRSCVAACIEFDSQNNAENFKNSLHKDIKDNFNCFVSEENRYFVTLELEWVKWYSGFEGYEDINKMKDSIVENSIDENGFIGFEFFRFGEDYDDFEYERSIEPPNIINFRRSLEFTY